MTVEVFLYILLACNIAINILYLGVSFLNVYRHSVNVLSCVYLSLNGMLLVFFTFTLLHSGIHSVVPFSC
jgi:hypothetical protein